MKTYMHCRAPRVLTTGLVSLGLSGAICFGPAAWGQPSTAAPSSPSLESNQNWEDQFDTRMQHIQQEMDSLFRDSLDSIDKADQGFFAGPKFDASSTVQDRGNDYVATFYLPKRDLSNVKVGVKDDVLSVRVDAEQVTRSDQKNDSSETEMLNAYEQLVTLPGPVDSAGMKVDKNGDSLVVTLPKKDEKSAAAK